MYVRIVTLPNKHVFLSLNIVSLTSARFFLTVVDDFTHCVWTFLMKSKTQTCQILTNFLSYIATQFNSQVKVVRTDNGSEFLSTICQTLFTSHGIVHQHSCPYTPQQNDVVEHKHHHLIQVARALLHHAGLPHHFWGEAVLTTTFLINRLPSSLLQWRTPYFLLTHTEPDFSFLKVFGCLCFATNLHPTKKKFDSRVVKSIFLGYVPNCKAYKLLDLQTNKVFASRDVIFYENIFLYQHNTSSSDHSSPLPTPALDISTEHFSPPPVPLPSTSSTPPTSDTSLPSQTPSLHRSTRPTQPPKWHED